MSDYYLGSMPLLVQEQLKEIRMAGYSVTIKSLDNIDEWLVEVRGRPGAHRRTKFHGVKFLLSVLLIQRLDLGKDWLKIWEELMSARGAELALGMDQI